MSYDCLIVFLFQEFLKAYLNSCLYCYMTFEFFRVSSLRKNVIFIIIFFHKSVNISLGNSVHIFCDFIYRIGINFPAKFNLSFYLIPLCNGNISHIVGHTANSDVAALHNANSSSHPGSQTLLNLFVSPVAHNYLSLDSHAGYHVTILAATVCGLILVHKVHVNGVVRDFLIELCVKVAKRLSIFLQTKYPGFCRGKSMHPGDHTSTVFISICLIESLTDKFIGNQSWFPYNLVWKHTGFVQLFHNNTGMLSYFTETLIPIKIL